MNRLSRPALVIGKRDLCGHRAAMGTDVKFATYSDHNDASHSAS
jgi:hypothetical protein